MCPYEPRNFEPPSPDDVLPYEHSETRKNCLAIDIPEELDSDLSVSLEELNGLMGTSKEDGSLLDRVSERYGTLQSLCSRLGSSVANGKEYTKDIGVSLFNYDSYMHFFRLFKL